jgi:hypothetical protein
MDFGYYLMVKEAVGLNIKYLCKCADYKDPIKYKGSGVYWKRILAKHKCDISTTILGHYPTNIELRAAGIYYSKLYNIVEDSTWANLIDEIGDGGNTTGGRVRGYNQNTFQIKAFNSIEEIPVGWVHGTCPKGIRIRSINAIEKCRKFHLGRTRSAETRQRMKDSTRKKRKTIMCNDCKCQITPQNLVRHQKKCVNQRII